MERVKKGPKRRYPYCGSNKWEFVEAVPITPEVLEKYLLVKYKCEKCEKLFLSEDSGGSKFVKAPNRCFKCNSRNIEKVSKEGADIELHRCKQCNAYMGIE